MDEAPLPMPIDDPALAERTVLVVVGAHLRAEVEDRPVAYALADRLETRLSDASADVPVIVCSDLWYLNDDQLRMQPTISIGRPDVNALGAFLGGRVPSAFAIDGVLVVQFDLERTDLVASCWGETRDATRSAVDAFCERYLDLFVDAALTRWAD